MDNSTMNFTTPEASSTSSNQLIGLVDILEMCAYSFYFLFGLPTHSYVTWLISTGTGSGVASEFFMLNLSVCEIVNSLNGLIFVLSVWFASLLTLETFLIGLTITGRPAFQCLMCVERYLAVVHPVNFLKFKPLRYRVICCTAAWIVSLGSCLCSMSTLLSQSIVQIWFMTVQLVLVLSIQLFCLVAVLRALKQSGPGERGKKRVEENHMKRRAYHLILITTVNSVILYVPFAITALFTILSGNNIKALWITCLILYVLGGFVQPVLYLQHTAKLSCLSAL
ncbi:C-C chemokine receptor type 8-like [Onychostoma macrolepis]|uniref:C-C chemokine receptor type 8-like n=1 Tax=Onychostoma macrolepis TaxID=369639 RepID=UPI00272C0951|nr:C-C chemokine receptor type 8-like [Onychostoma macrolepis]